MKEGEKSARGGPNLCPGHQDDVIYVQEKTREVAIHLEEIEEEKRRERALERKQFREAMREAKEQKQIESDQEELALLLQAQQMREERLKKKQAATAARGPPKPAHEAPLIQGLGNQTLAKRAKGNKNGPTIDGVVVETPFNGSPKSEAVMEVTKVILKPGRKQQKYSNATTSVDTMEKAATPDATTERKSDPKIRKSKSSSTVVEIVSPDPGAEDHSRGKSG